jgi:hypothetical protein
MRNLLIYVGLVLIAIWAIGAFAWHLGAMIHLLLLFAIIAFLFRVMKRKETKFSTNNSKNNQNGNKFEN